MKANKLLGIIAIAIITLALINCSNGGNNSPQSGHKTTVYIVGGYQNVDERYIPCYWKDGVRTELSATGNSVASAIAVSGSSIYVAGYYIDNEKNIACYWKDGVKTDLATVGSATVKGIAVSGGSIYVGGYYFDNGKNIACYWKDGVRTDFPAGDGHSYASAIAVSGDSIYLAGHYNGQFNGQDNSNKYIACYWKDDIKTDLPAEIGNSYIYAITISDNILYLAGMYNDESNNIGCYWKDGIKTDLSCSTAETITVSGESVYITGHYYHDNKYIYCYWKDGNKTDFNFSTDYSFQVGSAIVSGNSIYVVGYYYDDSRNFIKNFFWKNGVIKALPVPEGVLYSFANDIFVVDDDK
jgi:uncharacterized membrane protein